VRVLVLVLGLIGSACSTELPERAGEQGPTGLAWSVEPGGDPEHAPSLCRLSVHAAELDPADLWLFRGELSDYYLRRIHERDMPHTLLERAVPAVTWSRDGSAVLAPTRTLELGQSYSLAAAGRGLVGQLRIERQEPLWARIFPPVGSGFSGLALYCREQPATANAAETDFLEPSHVPVAVASGIDGLALDRCVRLEADVSEHVGESLLPPLGLEPEPLSAIASAPLVAASCPAPESAWGPGCASVQDDRVLLRVEGAPLLWSFSGALGPDVRVSHPGEPLLFGGLVPETEYVTEVVAHASPGAASSVSVGFVTLPARARVVINEVMANPLGPEPAAEWVELVNDGVIGVELSGWTLSDQGQATELPSFWLVPGGFVLIAREDYAPGPGDIAPAAGTAILSVHALGKNGLSNAGEALSLRRPDGAVASTFPALPKPKPGVSVARRTPSAVDDAPTSFALHGPPGASPGQANTF
jgi:hypothetical protein